MAYTIDYAYNKYLDLIDKSDSDFVSKDQFMELLQTETYDYIGEVVKFFENTEEIINDLRTLYKPYDILTTVDPNDAGFKVILFPDDYMHLMTVEITDGAVTVRQTKKYRHGNFIATKNNPNKRPTAEYPSVVMYNNYLRVHSPGDPVSAKGFYLMKPTFGDLEKNTADEIAVNLEDVVVEEIFRRMSSSHFSSTGDQRYASAKNQELGYRAKGK